MATKGTTQCSRCHGDGKRRGIGGLVIPNQDCTTCKGKGTV